MSEPTRVALVVFAEVGTSGLALDVEDAAVVVKRMIREQLKFNTAHHPDLPVRAWGDVTVVIRGAMEGGMASGNGYVWTSPSARVFREQPKTFEEIRDGQP